MGGAGRRAAQPGARLPGQLPRATRPSGTCGSVLAQRAGAGRHRSAGPLRRAPGHHVAAALRRRPSGRRLRDHERAVARQRSGIIARPAGRLPAVRRELTPFYQRVVAGDPRAPTTTHTRLLSSRTCCSPRSTRPTSGAIRDPHIGFAFHDYCSTEDLPRQHARARRRTSLTVNAAHRLRRCTSIPSADDGVRRDRRPDQPRPRWSGWPTVPGSAGWSGPTPATTRPARRRTARRSCSTRASRRPAQRLHRQARGARRAVPAGRRRHADVRGRSPRARSG